MAESVKKIRLHFGLFAEAISPMPSESTATGGWVETPEREPGIGDRMPDGTVYAGSTTLDGVVDPPTPAKQIYAAPTDVPLTLTFDDAASFAKQLNREKYLGHDDWRVPTKAELNVLFNNRSAIGGFNITGSNPSSWYWSSSPDVWGAWRQRFSDGYPNYNTDGLASVRLVR